MKRVIKIVVVLLVLAGVAWGAYEMYRRVQQRKRLAARTPERGPLKVAVVRLGRATLEKRTAVTGEIKALQTVDVVPKVVGVLQRLRLPDGTLLEEGTVIHPDANTGRLPVVAVIEHEALAAALQQAEAAHKAVKAAIVTAGAAIESARAAVKAAEVTYADCKRERDRMERLFQGGSGTEKQRDAARAAYDGAEAQQQRARAELAAAEARLAETRAGEAKGAAAVRQAQVALADATIEAPIAGIVTRKHVDEGNMVGPTTPLVRIARVETVKIVGGVSERHLSDLASGRTEAVVAVDAFPDEQFRGKVHLVGEAIETATRTVGVEVRVANPKRRLKPGMFARVQLVLVRKKNVPAVPHTAVLRDEEGPYVYVVNGSKAHRRRVKLGLTEGALHEVTDGVREGDVVVIRGQRQLGDGRAVVPVEEARP